MVLSTGLTKQVFLFSGANEWSIWWHYYIPDAKLLESIDAALCLDSIGLSQDSLHLHLSKLPSNDTRAFDLIQAVATSAANAGIQV
jgi:hypothetical protein